MGRKRMKKCSQDPAESRKSELPYLPFDVQFRILACLEIQDLFRSCLLVCKQWKDAILFSERFASLQYRQTLWGILHYSSPEDKKLIFENGPYKILNATLQHEIVACSDHGIVCLMNIDDNQLIRVGNPIKKEWQEFPASTLRSLVYCMKVDTSTSPASFKILAVLAEGDWGKPSKLQCEILDSKVGTWNKGNTIFLNGPFQDKLEGSLVEAYYNQKKILTYDFEQGRSTVKRYVSPQKYARERIILCKGEPILKSCLWPWVTLWKERSCHKGIIKWGLMAKLDIKTFLAQHKLKVEVEQEGITQEYQHFHCTAHVITVTVKLTRVMSALLDYDMRKGCWKFGGSVERTSEIAMTFSPSLITVK